MLQTVRAVRHEARVMEDSFRNTGADYTWSRGADGDGSERASAAPERPADALAVLYQDYAGQLSASLRKMYGDGPPDPDDVSQQAFQKLMERGDLGSIDNLKAFVWRTARNIVLGAKRSQTVRSRYDFEVEQIYFPLRDDESTPERIILVGEQLKLISEVLQKMPAKRRRAIILHRVEGLSVTEVGRRLGISRQNASRHLAKGIADLNIAFLSDEDSSE